MTIANELELRQLANRDLRYPTLYGRCRGALIQLSLGLHPDTPDVFAANVLAMLDEMEQIPVHYGPEEC